MSKSEIVICSTQRSGSSYLCQCFEEAGWGVPRESYKKLVSRMTKNIEMDYKNALEKSREQSTSNNIYSTKLMANGLGSFDYFLKKYYETSTDMSQELSNSKANEYKYLIEYYKNAKLVWLKRNNVVKQAISRITARKTGLYHSTSFDDNTDPTTYNKDIQIESKQLTNLVGRIACENSIWQHYFDSNGLDYVEVSYEDLLRDKNSVMQRLAKELSLTYTPIEIDKKLTKIGNSHTQREYSEHINLIKQKIMSGIPEEAKSGEKSQTNKLRAV